MYPKINEFSDTATTEIKTYTYEYEQDYLKITNKGNTDIIFNVGKYGEVVLHPAQIWENDVDYNSFTVKSFKGTCSVDIVTKDYGNTPATKADVSVVNESLAESTQQINTHTSQIASLASGSPKAVSLVSQMADTTKNYVYTGSEGGYTAGNWYYYNGSTWVSGGVYQSTGLSMDTIDSILKDKFIFEEVENENAINYTGYLGGSSSPTILGLKLQLTDGVYTNKATSTNAATLVQAVRSTNLELTTKTEMSADFNVLSAHNFSFFLGVKDDTTTSIHVNSIIFGYDYATKKYGYKYNNTFYPIGLVSDGYHNFKMVIDNAKVEFYLDNSQVGECDYITGYHKFFLNLQIGSAGEENLMQFKNIIVNKVYEKSSSNSSKLTGRNKLIYKFGGKGNDWCFVITPPSYDSEREKPYPFVICNHGNGWVMDGTPKFANWTKRTMYCESTDTDYIASPTQYNLVPTDKPELLYSNPTIEALLNAGYVVCGAENYGDNLYGNDNCRQACADFYQHMIKHYNVEEKCYMIGASNGGLTTLNAMYLLGGVARVKAIILQYPLTTLWKHYTGYTTHQSAIETAYSISTGLTETQFEKATRTHDPEKVCTITNVNGVSRFKTIPMPPIKIWYSLSDVVANPANNSLPFIQLLEDSNCVYESVVATGGHGDYTHFNPTEYVNWLEKWR